MAKKFKVKITASQRVHYQQTVEMTATEYRDRV